MLPNALFVLAKERKQKTKYKHFVPGHPNLFESLRLFSSIAFANDETNFPFMLALADTDRKKQKTVNLIFKLGANKSHQHHCCALFPQ